MAAAPLAETVRSKFASRLRDGAQQAFLDAYDAGIGELPGLDEPRACSSSSWSRRRPTN